MIYINNIYIYIYMYIFIRQTRSYITYIVDINP